MIPEEKLKEIQAEMLPATSNFADTHSSVYRLWYGDRYVIAKGKTLPGSIYLIQKGLAYFLAGGGRVGKGTPAGEPGKGHQEGQGKNTYYFQFYQFIKENPGLKWSVELILEHDNGYQLLKREQIELEAAIKDKKCLNSNVIAYIPKFRKESALYGDWIKPTHVLNFKKFLKRPSPVDPGNR